MRDRKTIKKLKRCRKDKKDKQKEIKKECHEEDKGKTMPTQEDQQ
jgi:hypothetical protein